MNGLVWDALGQHREKIYVHQTAPRNGPTDEESRLLFISATTHVNSPFQLSRIAVFDQFVPLIRFGPPLLRDIFGNPFRPVTFHLSWLSPTVVALANGIDADHAFDRMPILADALEEAGCDNVNVLLHCRGNGPHVRGCWVVDGVLGKQ